MEAINTILEETIPHPAEREGTSTQEKTPERELRGL